MADLLVGEDTANRDALTNCHSPALTPLETEVIASQGPKGPALVPIATLETPQGCGVSPSPASLGWFSLGYHVGICTRTPSYNHLYGKINGHGWDCC